MKTTEYLYELDLESLENMKYFKALQYKSNCARRLYSKLLNESKIDTSDELEERKFYVYRAWQHNEKLLRERDERS